jgi:hypothetical protein
VIHSRIEDRVIPVSSVSNVGNGQDNILLREIQHDSRIQSVDVGLDNTRTIDRRKVALIEYGIDTNVLEHIAGKVTEDEQRIRVLFPRQSPIIGAMSL